MIKKCSSCQNATHLDAKIGEFKWVARYGVFAGRCTVCKHNPTNKKLKSYWEERRVSKRSQGEKQ